MHPARAQAPRMATTAGIVLTFLWHLVVFAIVVGLLWWAVKTVLALPPLAPVAPYAKAILVLLVVALALGFLFSELGTWGEWGVGYRRHWL
jgi:hypothetical protein